MQNLIPHFIERQFKQQKVQGHFDAYTMFIDLTDFTPLTEKMMSKGKQGAEQLSEILNGIFSPLVQQVYKRGGFIPYFAGDAFTAIFPTSIPGFDISSILNTAVLTRDLVRGLPVGDSYTTGVKIGLSAGRIEWGIVGKQLKTFYFRGEGIESCVEAQIIAGDQEIILSEKLAHKAANLNTVTLQALEEGNFYKLSQYHFPPDNEVDRSIAQPDIDIKTLEYFLPETIYRSEHSGEFRNVISIFLSFKGANDHEQLDRFITVVLDQFKQFSGYFKEVDFGDKGGVLVGFFGAPVTFEKFEDRALEFVQTLKETLDDSPENKDIKYRIGLTMGTAFTGIVGGKARNQYSVVGNWVNIAARLMTKAAWGEIIVGPELQKNTRFVFRHKGDLQYKGVRGTVPTYLLEGKKEEFIPSSFSGNMTGRKRELEQLSEFSKPLAAGQPAGVVQVFGDAGTGKSRLIFELKQKIAKQYNIRWIHLQADQILRKPFHPFIQFLKKQFKQSAEAAAATNKAEFEKIFDRLMYNYSRVHHHEMALHRRELWRTKPVIAALLDIPYEDTLWKQLDARGRFENTVSAILSLLSAEALSQPLVLQVEDAHSLDENSKALLQQLLRRISRLPLMLIIISRYNDDGSKPVVLPNINLWNTNVLELNLDTLPYNELRQMATDILGGSITDEFSDLLVRITNGNPFYLEQILQYFIENKFLTKTPDKWTLKDKEVKVSNSIQAILMARIDRLSNLVKETVKTAAVIGREFEVPVLSEVMSQFNSKKELKRGESGQIIHKQVKAAEQVKIWQAINELRYIFQHSLLREAVYDMQLHTRLKKLHRHIAQAIEKLYSENLDAHFIDLAFHYRQAEVPEKAIEYLGKAANHARSNYQNLQALELYGQLLKLLEEHPDRAARIRTLLRKSGVHELIGQWDACEAVLTKAVELADKLKDDMLKGRTRNELGRLQMLRGNYEAAKKQFEEAVTFFENINDRLGMGKVYGNLGNLFFRRGQYNKAKEFLYRSLELNQEKSYATADAQIVATIGLAHMNQGQYADGIAVIGRQIDRAREQEDKRGMSTLLTNLGIVYFEKGDFDKALDCYHEGLKLSEELGNKLLISIATGCIGSVYQEQGDYQKAMEHFMQDLDICEELGDKQGLAIAKGLIGELLAIEGAFDKAKAYLKESLKISEQLSYQKGIAKAANNLGDIHYLQKEFEAAANQYERAIAVTRAINNKLVLGRSLVERGLTLLEMNRLKEAENHLKDAEQITDVLDNQDLQFQLTVFAAKVAHRTGNKEKALRLLNDFLHEDLPDAQQAAIYYNLYELEDTKEAYRTRALNLFRTLYAKTPKYIFKKRIEMLVS